MRVIFRFSILIISVLIIYVSVVACDSNLNIQRMPKLTFSHLNKINLNISNLMIISRYKSPMKKPNVEHLFSSRPERFLKQWSSDRLKASGQKGLAKFTIYKASIIEEKLQLDPSVIGMFTKQQSDRYTSRVEASLEIIDKSGMRKGFVNANAIRSKTVREDATINEREDVLFSLVEDLIIEFDREIANNIKNHLADWLI